jgi:predicted Zn-dependent peptidase
VRVLDNGLTVQLVPLPHLHSAFVGHYVRVGSRHEARATNGLSHFLEHMLFRGCEGFRTPGELNAAIEDLGGQWEGFTTRDYTGYQTSVHPSGAAEAIEILGRMIQTPSYEDIEVERRIVVEEMLDALDENGRNIELDTVAHDHAFRAHALGWPIEGTRKNLERFDVEGLETHRRKFYGAENSVLCVAGAFDARKTLRAIRRGFGALFEGRRRTDRPRPRSLQPPKPLRYVRDPGPQSRLRISFRVAPEQHDDHRALVLLRRWLDGGLSARLQVELVDRLGLAYEVGASLESYSDVGVFDFELNTTHEHLADAIDALGELLAETREAPIDRREFTRVQRRAESHLEFMLDAPADLGGYYGVGRLFRDVESPQARLATIQALEPEDVTAVARRHLTRRRASAAAVGGADPATVRRARGAYRRFLRRLGD